MVIAIDASQANRRERTGTEWYAFRIISEWIKHSAFEGHRVILYTREPLLDDFPTLPRHWKSRVLRWPPKILWTQVRLSAEILFHKIHVLYVPSHALPFFHPKKTYTTIHDIGFEKIQHIYGNKSVARVSSSWWKKILSLLVRLVSLGKYGANELDYHRFTTRFALKKARAIFTVSQFSKEEISRTFPVHPPIQVAYNGIEHDDFYFPYPKNRIDAVKKQYAIRKPYILAVGRVEKKKNSFDLVRSYAEYITTYNDKDTNLIFAGSGGLGYEDVLEYVKKHSLDARIFFLGWVPQEHIAPLMAGATLFAQFSEYEGFGVPVIQSLAVGTPVLANKLPVFTELAGDAVFFCNAHDTQESSRALHHALNRPHNEIEATRKKGIAAAKKFSWKETAVIIEKQLLA